MLRGKLGRKPTGKVETKTFALKGGLNLVDAPITIPYGMTTGCINYELLSRDGYRRIDGYERCDGQASPSDATYWILDFMSGDISEPEVTGIVYGGTSGATAEVGLVVVSTGAWSLGTATGYLVLFDLDGIFIDTEPLYFIGAGDDFNYEYSNEFN